MGESTAIRVLLELTRRLATTGTVQSGLGAVTEAAVDLFGADYASVRLFDDKHSEVDSRGGDDVADSGETVLELSGIDDLTGWVVENGRVARVGDCSRDERCQHSAGDSGLHRSILAVPLWSAGRVIGVLAMVSDEADAFSEDDEVLAQLLGNCAVPPIERARLARLVVTDHHTGAFNQRYLFPRLRQEINRAQTYAAPLSVLLMDLDHFKRVNDGYGHAAGDDLLRRFADRVESMVRRPDILVRRGGDEFVLIMPFTHSEQALIVAERIRRSLDQERVGLADGTDVHQTVSIGVATWDGRETAESLEERADRAMYEGKRLGRNRVVHSRLSSDQPADGAADEG
jgi:diguanylate cyclase (GGDEF)-like protein